MNTSIPVWGWNLLMNFREVMCSRDSTFLREEFCGATVRIIAPAKTFLKLRCFMMFHNVSVLTWRTSAVGSVHQCTISVLCSILIKYQIVDSSFPKMKGYATWCSLKNLTASLHQHHQLRTPRKFPRTEVC